jgi:hypothetical protein
MMPAVAALARVLDSHLTRLAVPLFAVGAGLALADSAFGLKVSYDLATGPSFEPPPSWYGPMNDWAARCSLREPGPSARRRCWHAAGRFSGTGRWPAGRAGSQ